MPGIFAVSAEDIVGWLQETPQRRLVAALRAHAAAGACVAASCAGTWALAEAGLLDGRSATTVWWLAPQFRRRYPRVQLEPRELVVIDGGLTTAGAALAHTDLMLNIVARQLGQELAEQCARLLMAEFRHGQSRHLKIAWLAGADPVMARAQRWIERHIGKAISVAALAEHLGMTPRTLARRCEQSLGMSPLKLVQRQRVELAVDLLKHSRLPFAKVAAHVGYADPGALRRLIRREMGDGALRQTLPGKG